MSKFKEFVNVYRVYRKAAHPRVYCLKMVYNTVYRGFSF